MKQIKYFQEGGEMPQEQSAQATPQGGGLEEPIRMMQQAVQANDGNMALQACQMFLQTIEQMQGGGGEAPTQQPAAFMKGGVMKKKMKSKKPYKKGGKIEMVKDSKTGKMVPKFAMDGKGSNDMRKKMYGGNMKK